MPNTLLFRQCPKCGEQMVVVSGRYRCPPCRALYMRGYADGHRDAVLSAKAKYRLENRKTLRDKNKIYHAANREYRNNRSAIYNEANREKINEAAKQWHRDKPERGVVAKQNRRARTHAFPGTVTTSEWLEIKLFYNFTCLRCGLQEPEIKLSLDHVIPLARGGSNTKDNVQPLCLSCNSIKHTRNWDFREVLLHAAADSTRELPTFNTIAA